MTNVEIINLLEEYKNKLLKLRYLQDDNYQKVRTFLNKNLSLVQRILTTAGTLKLICVTPPPLVGGLVMKNVNTLNFIFDPPYGLDVRGLIADDIEQAIGIIETTPDFSKELEIKPQPDNDHDVWSLIHPSIVEVSKKRINDGYYADAVESACKYLNTRVRDIVLDRTREELDGAGLMRKAFSPSNPIIKISSDETRSGRDTQQGYMDIFAGVMTGIRNPKAHDNNVITKEDALRKLIMISLLMFKIDGSIAT